MNMAIVACRPQTHDCTLNDDGYTNSCAAASLTYDHQLTLLQDPLPLFPSSNSSSQIIMKSFTPTVVILLLVSCTTTASPCTTKSSSISAPTPTSDPKICTLICAQERILTCGDGWVSEQFGVSWGQTCFSLWAGS